MALDGNPARFTVNGLPSEDAEGNRAVVVANGALLTLQLEVIPSGALSATFEIFDPAIETSPLASLNAPQLDFLTPLTGSSVLLTDPDNQTATINMAALGANPNTDIHTYLFRCTVSKPSGPQVFERAIMTRGVNSGLRKTFPAESQESEARGWSDEINRMVAAIEGLAGGGAGNLQSAYNFGAFGGTVTVVVDGTNDLNFDEAPAHPLGSGLFAIRRNLGAGEETVFIAPDTLDDVALLGTDIRILAGGGSNQATADTGQAGTEGGTLTLGGASPGGVGSDSGGSANGGVGGVGSGVVLLPTAGGVGGVGSGAFTAGAGGAGGAIAVSLLSGGVGGAGTASVPGAAGGVASSIDIGDATQTVAGGVGGASTDIGQAAGVGGAGGLGIRFFAPAGGAAGADVSGPGADGGAGAPIEMTAGAGGTATGAGTDGVGGGLLFNAGPGSTDGTIQIGVADTSAIISGVGNEGSITRWTHGGLFAIDYEQPSLVFVNREYATDDARRWLIRATAWGEGGPPRLAIGPAQSNETNDGFAFTADRLVSTGSSELTLTTVYGNQIRFESSNSVSGETPTVLIRPQSGGATGDAAELLTLESVGTNSEHLAFHVGDRTPIGNVTGNPGDYYYRVGGVNSTTYQHQGASANNTSWTDLNAGGGGGEANTASNSGTVSLVLAKSGVDLPFRGLLGINNIGVAINANNVEIDGTLLALVATDMIAGAGLTGGGTLAANRTFNVIANADASVVVNANDIQVGVLATDAQHGVRGGGTQHAAAIDAGASGFMTGTQVTQLAALVAAGTALQDAYDSGNTIAVVTASGPVSLSNSTDVTNVLEVARTFIGAGHGAVINMGAGNEAVTGDGLRIQNGTGHTAAGALLRVISAAGSAADVFELQAAGGNILTVSAAGGFEIAPPSGESWSLDAAGAGAITLAHAGSGDITLTQDGTGDVVIKTTAGAVNVDAVGGILSLDGDSVTIGSLVTTIGITSNTTLGMTGGTGATLGATTGDVVVNSVAGAVNLQVVGATKLGITSAGAVNVTPTSGQDATITTAGGGNAVINTYTFPDLNVDTFSLPDANGAAGSVLTDVAGDGALTFTAIPTVDLQTAYDNGPAILVDATGPIAISNATTADDLMTLVRTFVGAGSALVIDMGPGNEAVTDIGLDISSGTGATGTMLFVNNLGSGNALDVQDGGASVLQVTAAGAVNVNPTSGQSFSATTLGAGDIALVAGDALTMQAVGTVTLENTAFGDVVINAAAGNITLERADGAVLTVDAAGKVSVTPTSGQNFDVTTPGASGDINLIRNGVEILGGGATVTNLGNSTLLSFDIGGNPILTLNGTTLNFDADVVAPFISQADETTTSTAGETLTLKGQAATGLTSDGGDILVLGGDGTQLGGDAILQAGTGGTTNGQAALLDATNSGGVIVGPTGAISVLPVSGENVTINMVGGGVFAVQDDGTPVLSVDAAGEVVIQATSGQNVQIEAAGVGQVVLESANAIGLTSGADLSLTADGAALDINFAARSSSAATYNQSGDVNYDETAAGEVLNGATSVVGAINRLARAATLLHGESLDTDTTSGSTAITKTSLVIPDETGTWEITGYASVSHSNSTGNPNVWLENTSDTAELGTRPRWVWEPEDASNDIATPVIYRRFSNTSGNGAKTVAVRYAVGTGSGTMSISDAYITARKVG